MHYGSLVTAVASYLQARSQNGQWLIRIEDIDPPREQKGATQSILQTLNDYGFHWDHRPIYQSNRSLFHKHIALQLLKNNAAYSCACSRKDLATDSIQGNMGLIYPGICATKSLHYTNQHTIRIRANDSNIEYVDNNFGPQHCNMRRESGDYVIYRSHNLPSYILAVSVDDLYEQYTEIVRGADLLAITPRQIHLSNILQNKSPTFLHIPVITHENGDKLSKQTHAPSLKKHHARSWLFHALTDLGQEPPRSLQWRPLWVLWDWAGNHWQADRLPKTRSIKLNH